MSSSAGKPSDATQRRVAAAKKYIEEMYKSQAQALRDRRKRRSLLEQELKQQTTQVSQRYYIYILREREEAKGLSGRGGLGKRRPRHFVHMDSVTTAPSPPHTHTHNVLKV